MCKALVRLTVFVLTLMLFSVSAIQQMRKLTDIVNATNDAETEVSSLHEMSTIESVVTTTPTTTTDMAIMVEVKESTAAIAASEVTTLNPFEKNIHLNNNNNGDSSDTITTPTPAAPPSPSTDDDQISLDPYCQPSLCELFNGTHIQVLPHIACHNRGNFAPSCGTQPHLLYMSERRRNLILDLHNLARSRIASGQVADYKPAAHMPQLKWDSELQHLATLHAKRCKFTHDRCRNTARYPYSGQNIGYYWIRREIKSHSRRIKNFIVNWFKEYQDANQTYIDSYRLHPDGKPIGHFTQLVSDRTHRVGCAAIRYHEPDQLDDTKFLLTCNYDYTNIWGESIYQSGPTASKCVYKRSEKFPSLCDWKVAVYEYESEQIVDDDNLLDNNILASLQ